MKKRNNNKNVRQMSNVCLFFVFVKEKTKMLETILGKVKFIKEVEIIMSKRILEDNLHCPR
jgi:hypothetical protein